MELPDKEDAFARLEKGVEDKRRGREGAERLAELREDSAAKYKDDYTINKALRRQLRYALAVTNACLISGFCKGAFRVCISNLQAA